MEVAKISQKTEKYNVRDEQNKNKLLKNKIKII